MSNELASNPAQGHVERIMDILNTLQKHSVEMRMAGDRVFDKFCGVKDVAKSAQVNLPATGFWAQLEANLSQIQEDIIATKSAIDTIE